MTCSDCSVCVSVLCYSVKRDDFSCSEITQLTARLILAMTCKKMIVLIFSLGLT